MNNIEYTLAAMTPGTSQKLSIVAPGTAVVTSAAIGADFVVLTPTVDCFFRKGSTPVATNDGTDQFLVAKNTYRVFGLLATDKLSFNGPTAGDIYITPSA
jgi:hypothetical protein